MVSLRIRAKISWQLLHVCVCVCVCVQNQGFRRFVSVLFERFHTLSLLPFMNILFHLYSIFLPNASIIFPYSALGK